MFNPPDSIVGASVRLRRSTPADSEAMFRAASDPDVMRFMEWPAHESVADAEAYMGGCTARWAAGVEYHWVIERSAGGPLLGCIACRVKGHAVDFGYFLARSAWGQGIATEASSLLVAWLQSQPAILRIWATVDAENARSASVLVRLGMQREGLLRMATYRPNIGGLPRDTVVYALCKSDA
ncbi:GNAT family N-acetyltransferase [Pseudoxanthomonas sp.]|uniref:GNAT family N-acetyltransferase n=1 Tax=Pseudoxanthomonas sp. TaxID=1871049 RepID=UPI002639793C|nr:GNAT family N-acetyltransferase [Pseudoxanthomonas sp.]WDS35246.1 MAG: GNAT family N-acetyltransferase [Pseudoxanthomonas sp.]